MCFDFFRINEVEWPKWYLGYVGRNFTKLLHPILWKLNGKIGLATQMETQLQLSSTPMQVTNYGLGGLCECHIDPHGYIEGTIHQFLLILARPQNSQKSS